MSSLTCTVCNIDFLYKIYFLRYQKSIQCSQPIDLLPKEPLIIADYNYKFCNTFTTHHKPNLYRHFKKCKLKIIE